MKTVLRIFHDNEIKDIDLTSINEYSVGVNGSFDYIVEWDSVLPAIYVKRIGSDFAVKTGNGNYSDVTYDAVNKGYMIADASRNREYAMLLNIHFQYNRYQEIAGQTLFGRTDKNDSSNRVDLNCALPFIGRKQFMVFKDGNRTVLKNLLDSFGQYVYVNDYYSSETELEDGDVISIYNHQLEYRDGRILYCNPEMQDSTLDFGGDTLSAPVGVLSAKPEYYRTIRKQVKINSEEVQRVLEDPYEVSKGGSSLLSSMLYAMYNPIFGGISAAQYGIQKWSYRKMKKAAIAKYEEYLKIVEADYAKYETEKRTALNYNYPSSSECSSFVMNRDPRLFERNTYDSDFLELRVGTGDVPSNFNLTATKVSQTSIEKENPLTAKANELAGKTKVITDAPVTVKLNAGVPLKIFGERENRYEAVGRTLVEAATLHSYYDVKFVALLEKSDYSNLDYMRWLPHFYTNERKFRFIACTPDDMAGFLPQLKSIITSRYATLKSEETTEAKPYIVFYISNRMLFDRMMSEINISAEELMKPGMNISFIDFSSSDIPVVPARKTMVLNCDSTPMFIYSNDDITDRQYFEFDKGSLDYNAFARKMSSIYLVEKQHVSVPERASFFEGYKVNDVKELNIEERWKSNRFTTKLDAMIGLEDGGKPFYFSLYSNNYGPFGLAAGTTGSGKTEMMQSWILSLAVNYSPKDVSFVLIDFKGASLINPFIDMPHLAGYMSNLDGDENKFNHCHRVMSSIEHELERRQQIIRNCGEKNKDINDIHDLHKAQKKGEFKDIILPYVIIVIDEFQAFKEAYPDFTKVIEKIFAQGRGLGMLMLLATQSPDGVITGKMEDNIGFRWCLNVSDIEKSAYILGKGIYKAAMITNPGRAFVRIKNTITEVQPFYSKSNIISKANRDKSAASVAEVLINGQRAVSSSENMKTQRVSGKEIEAVVKRLGFVAEQDGYGKSPEIWKEKLSDNISYFDIESPDFSTDNWDLKDDIIATVGIADDFYNQKQIPLTVNFNKEKNTIVYGTSQVGKSTLLQTIILSLALNYSPQKVDLHVIDFGTSLIKLKMLPQVKYTMGNNKKDLAADVKAIDMMLSQRQRKLQSTYSESVKEYEEKTGEKLPTVFVFVDNLQKFPDDYDEFLEKLVAEGPGYGIYFVASSNSSSDHMRVVKEITNMLVLKVGTNESYQSIFECGTLEFKPEDKPGRGLCRLSGINIAEFQTALPVFNEKGKDTIEYFSNLMQESFKETSDIDEEVFEEQMEPDNSYEESTYEEDSYVQPYDSSYDYDDEDFVYEEKDNEFLLGSYSGKAVTLDITPGQIVFISSDQYMKYDFTSDLAVILSRTHDVVLFDCIDENLQSMKDNTDIRKYIKGKSKAVNWLDENRDEIIRRMDETDIKPVAFIFNDFINADGINSTYLSLNEEYYTFLTKLVRHKDDMALSFYFVTDRRLIDMSDDEFTGLKKMISECLSEGCTCITIGDSPNEHTMAKKISKDIEESDSEFCYRITENGTDRFVMTDRS